MKPIVSPDNHATLAEALADLETYNLLQPNQAMSMRQGVEARRRQWNQMAGGQAGKPDYRWIGAGLVGGLLTGAIASLVVPPVPSVPVPMSLLLALLLAPAGGYVGHLLSNTGAYSVGMMLVIVNERRSVIRPEMVSGQVEAWIPKALLAWRSHEWRYKNGRPYLWLQLPTGQRIQDVLKTTLDYLFLPNDLLRAHDAAVYARRSWNRMISDNALDFADVDKGDRDAADRLKELLPYLMAAGIILGGILLVIMTSD